MTTSTLARSSGTALRPHAASLGVLLPNLVCVQKLLLLQAQCWDKRSVTVRREFFKPEKGRYLHPVEDRALTHYEAATLQGFPDEYLFMGSKIEITRQIGNAVPIASGAAIGRHLAGLLA